MPQPTDALDFRRAHESVILDALAVGHPLALAEAYHRSVPAAHAVARRLMGSADNVEALLLQVFANLWSEPPSSGPLEGWIRRQTWAMGVERLREAGTAPASPSAAGLLPDLPAPDVRFLDAAERAIAELAEDERRALLLSHDKGVPTTGQEDGAADALTRALMALAGPENSSGDRAALHEDGCDDLDKIGDWCLGVASARENSEVANAIGEREGCAAKSRATRRGRRRIEGLPATPDMGQRILVTVLSDRPGVRAAAEPATVDDAALAAGPEPVADAGGPVTAIGEADSVSRDEADVDAPVMGAEEDVDSLTAEADAVADDAPADPFDALDATGPLPSIEDYVPDEPVEDAPVAPSDGDAIFQPADESASDLPSVAATTELTEAELVAAGFGGEIGVEDSDLPADDQDAAPAELPEEELFASDDDDGGDWRPDPGSTAELRLSDILAEGEDDDPFADLDDDEPAIAGGDPYAALGSLEEGADETPAFGHDRPEPGVVALDDEYDGYIEGDDHVVDATRGGPSALTTWVLPAIVGVAAGLIMAILILGLP